MVYLLPFGAHSECLEIVLLLREVMGTYLFDFDGTLVDSMPTFSSIMLGFLDEHGISYGNDLIKIITPLGYAGTAKYFVGLGVEMAAEEIANIVAQRAVDAYEKRIPAKKNVIAVLQQLKEQGHHLNILTASPHLMLDPCLKRLGIYDLFENVWSCDDFYTTKSNPEIYKMAAERMGQPVDCVLFLDDNFHADQTAKSAGMLVCGVYDESSRDYEDKIREIADYYIRDFSELLSFEWPKG